MSRKVSPEAIHSLFSGTGKYRRKRKARDEDLSFSDEELEPAASPSVSTHIRWPTSDNTKEADDWEDGVYEEEGQTRDSTPLQQQKLASGPTTPAPIDDDHFRYSLKGLYYSSEAEPLRGDLGVERRLSVERSEPYSPAGSLFSSNSFERSGPRSGPCSIDGEMFSSTPTTLTSPPQWHSPLALPLADKRAKPKEQEGMTSAVAPDVLQLQEQLRARWQALAEKMPWQQRREG